MYTALFLHILCCKVIRRRIDLKLKVRTEYPTVWGEYKHHSNPYIPPYHVILCTLAYGPCVRKFSSLSFKLARKDREITWNLLKSSKKEWRQVNGL